MEADTSESTGTPVSIMFPVNTAFDIYDQYGASVSNPNYEIYSYNNIQYTSKFMDLTTSANANKFLPYLNVDLDDTSENIASEKSSYVFVVIWPGPDGVLNAENADGDDTFSNAGDDVVVGLSFHEWKKLMANRICDQVAFLNYTTRNRKHWFQPYDSKLNKSGRNWVYSTDPEDYKGRYADDDRYFLCSTRYRK